MYKKILIPVDGSENATLACSHAIALAKSGNMEVVLLSCYEMQSARVGAGGSAIAASLEGQCKGTLASCESLCAENGLKYKCLIKCGNPSKCIIEAAEEEDCDLIVIGSRGLGSIVGTVMGSVTSQVLRDSSIPVLVVRKKKQRK